MNYDTRGLKIMVAESDRTVLEMLLIRLQVAGYDTCMARTGPVAVQALRGFRPAALVIALELPEMDAFEVLQALYPRGEKPPYPILLTARKIGPEDVERGVRLGVRDCLAKPFSGADALDRIARLLRRPASPAPGQRAEVLLPLR